MNDLGLTLGFSDIKYTEGANSLIYSADELGEDKVVKVRRNYYGKSSDRNQKILEHEFKIGDKLYQKGYPVPKVYGVHRFFRDDWGSFVPGLVMEDIKNVVPLGELDGGPIAWKFALLYDDFLNRAEKDGFRTSRENDYNCLCDLENEKIIMIDFEFWSYYGPDEVIKTPHFNPL